MLTLKQIEEQRDFVVSRLAVKHVKNAEETVDRIIELNRLRRQMQAQNDAVLCELNQTSKSIGMLLKNGKTDEADEAKKHTGELKAATAELDRKMAETAQQIQDLLVTLPNLPHISVPEGYGAEDNVVVRMGGKMPELPEGALPHWELARKYDIIDFELGVKLTGAGFPVYKNQGARLQRALINFFLDRATAAGYHEIEPPVMVNEQSGFATGQLPGMAVLSRGLHAACHEQ